MVPRLSLTAGLAVVRAIAVLTGAHATIKWPNDIRIGGKKVAGILTEARVDTGGSATVVVGVGLNLTLDVAGYADIRETATSLRAATGRDAGVSAAANEVLGELNLTYQELLAGGDVVASWRSALDTLGSRVTVRSDEEALTGLAKDVAADGSLLVQTDDGRWLRVSAGEVTSQQAP
jgi:BirA family biotin operon repressor/biotin-[acetyl-CoA-carboxylase] ligase